MDQTISDADVLVIIRQNKELFARSCLIVTSYPEYFDHQTRFNDGGAPVAEKRLMHTMFGKAKVEADKVLAYLT